MINKTWKNIRNQIDHTRWQWAIWRNLKKSHTTENIIYIKEASVMFKSYENFWRNFFNFKGTSSKSDFWWPVLINSLLFLFLKIVCDIFIDPAIVSILLYILSMPIMFGTISCITRRLRDAGYLWFNLFLLAVDRKSVV